MCLPGRGCRCVAGSKRSFSGYGSKNVKEKKPTPQVFDGFCFPFIIKRFLGYPVFLTGNLVLRTSGDLSFSALLKHLFGIICPSELLVVQTSGEVFLFSMVFCNFSIICFLLVLRTSGDVLFVALLEAFFSRLSFWFWQKKKTQSPYCSECVWWLVVAQVEAGQKVVKGDQTQVTG